MSVKVYDHNDWRDLSRRLALKSPNPPIVRFSRPVVITCALVLLVLGLLNWLGYYG
jgi:hypothetical protein